MATKKGFGWDRLTAIVAVIIATVSLWISANQNNQQLELTRRHNELSVMPYISSFSRYSRLNERIGFGIRNVGLGPAQIELVKVAFDKEWIEGSMRTASRKILKTVQGAKLAYGGLGKGAVLSPELEKWFFYSEPSKNYKKKRETLKQIRGRIGLFICYCSFYGECKAKLVGKLPEEKPACLDIRTLH